jgi:hypothetical protein
MRISAREKKEGGLNMPDFKTMLMVSNLKWLRRIISNKQGMCSHKIMD